MKNYRNSVMICMLLLFLYNSSYSKYAEIFLVQSKQDRCNCKKSLEQVSKVLYQEGQGLFTEDESFLDWHYNKEYLITKYTQDIKFALTSTVKLDTRNNYLYSFELIELENEVTHDNPLFEVTIVRGSKLKDLKKKLSPIIKELKYFLLNGKFKTHLEVHNFKGNLEGITPDIIEEIKDKLTKVLNDSELNELYNFIKDKKVLELEYFLSGTYRSRSKLKLQIHLEDDVIYCKPVFTFNSSRDIDEQVSELAKMVIKNIKST